MNLRSFLLLSFVALSTVPVLAQETEVDALPVTFTDESVSVVEGNTAFIRLTAEEVQETTRVRVRITPDTARSGTDYRNPGIVTVTFYKNGLTNKRIGVRTVNRSGAQNTRSFTASIISINGKAIAADDAEILEVTITDRSAVTTTPPRTTTGIGAVDPVKETGATVGTTPTVTQPRCVAGNSTSLNLTRLAGTGNRTVYTVGRAYHQEFKVPEYWVPAHPSRDGGAYKILTLHEEPRPSDLMLVNGVNKFDMEIAISECPGDFNPQTSCYYSTKNGEIGAANSIALIAPTANRNLVKGLGGYCEIQGGPGGKQYYYNVRYNDCFSSNTCQPTPFNFYAFMIDTAGRTPGELETYCRDGNKNPFNSSGIRTTTRYTGSDGLEYMGGGQPGVQHSVDSIAYKYCMSMGHGY